MYDISNLAGENINYKNMTENTCKKCNGQLEQKWENNGFDDYSNMELVSVICLDCGEEE